MELLLLNQRTQSCLSSLGIQIGDKYEPSQNCLGVLEEIYQKLVTEDKVTRNFRRAIHFSRGLENDIIPLLLQSNDERVTETIIRILACLLVPIECLLPMEFVGETNNGQLIVYELKAFLSQSKIAFRDPRTTEVILQTIKSIVLLSKEGKPLNNRSCDTINNCLLILRNVLHIPDSYKNLQNIIIWNLFLQNIDQTLLQLMTHDNKAHWSVSTVQLVAVLYKDQHVGTLQKLLHVWFEGSLGESSEDNESNTTQVDARSVSSPTMSSSEPTSDSSETSGKPGENEPPPSRTHHGVQRPQIAGSTLNCELPDGKIMAVDEGSEERKSTRNGGGIVSGVGGCRSRDDDAPTKATGPRHHRPCSRNKLLSDQSIRKIEKTSEALKRSESFTAHEFADFEYTTHLQTPEAMSTSSNEDESPHKRPAHQKPHIQKTRYISKQHHQHSHPEKKEARRKALTKRRKNEIMNKKALGQHNPRDEDMTHLLTEFTVEFLSSGYDPLVTTLLDQLVLQTSSQLKQLPLDTSHFFWLLTYFLKFTVQLELDLDQVRGALSYRLLSYLVFEGVSITEQIEQAVYLDGDVKPLLRRQHLVVTAIREFILSIEAYNKVTYLSSQDRKELRDLRMRISCCCDLKSLFVLMIRLFHHGVHKRQYLEDLVVTNHILLIFLEQQNGASKGELLLSDHLKQFATIEIMRNYGIVLEDFQSNGEFLNDCVFTMMHHIGGEIDQVSCLYQPNILKTFTQIWEFDVQLCEDWSDLVEYVIHRFVDLPRSSSIDSSAYNSGSNEDLDNAFGWLGDDSKQRMANFVQFHEKPAITAQLSPMAIQSDWSIQASLERDPKKRKIASLLEMVSLNGLRDQTLWLQRFILQVWLTKSTDVNSVPLTQQSQDYQPVAYYYSLINEPIPLVPWTCALAKAFRNKSFQCLLFELGFPPPERKVFHRIPAFWTLDDLLACAQKLGPIDSNFLARVEPVDPQPSWVPPIFSSPTDSVGQPFTMSRAKNSTSMINQTPFPNLPSSWLDVVKKSKSAADISIRKITSVDPSKMNLSTETRGSDFCKMSEVNVASDTKPAQLNLSPRNMIIDVGDSCKNFEVDDRDVECASVVSVCEADDVETGSVVDDVECASVVSICNSQASDATRMCISDEESDLNDLAITVSW